MGQGNLPAHIQNGLGWVMQALKIDSFWYPSLSLRESRHVIFFFLDEERKVAKAHRHGCHRQGVISCPDFCPSCSGHPSEVLDRMARLPFVLWTGKMGYLCFSSVNYCNVVTKKGDLKFTISNLMHYFPETDHLRFRKK